jgi:serine/threonine protein kinase
MSPEQAQGKSSAIDHRSDIFSFGCMLFEAVTKRRPFEGESNVQALYKIVYEPAPLIKDFAPSAPADLQRIIRRCLAKDPDERYQSIHDVALELKEVRRDMEDGTQLDATLPPASSLSEAGAASNMQGSLTQTIGSQISTGDVSAARVTASTDSILRGVKNRKTALALTLVG